ncbi:MAG TPA: DUF1801 domain-containing protein [Myxococcota bacterium]|jgi:hypothetical protein|nr:DUF1801 domain-containing protein [Myxococcota bacterium]
MKGTPTKARGPKSAGRAKPRKPSRASPTKPAPRADFGAPIEGFFGKQPPALRAILLALRALLEEAAPDAASSIKWGMPFYTVGGTMMCALTAHKSHVNLVLSGPPSAYADPDGLLSGEGKTGRHLKVTSLANLPSTAVRAWLRTAAALARQAP